MQQSPGDQFCRRPRIGVRPEKELVCHPSEHADGGVVHSKSEGARFCALQLEVGTLRLGEPGIALEASFLKGGVFRLLVEVGLRHHDL